MMCNLTVTFYFCTKAVQFNSIEIRPAEVNSDWQFEDVCADGATHTGAELDFFARGGHDVF